MFIMYSVLCSIRTPCEQYKGRLDDAAHKDVVNDDDDDELAEGSRRKLAYCIMNQEYDELS